MQTIKCPHCAVTFNFDPKSIWNSPGTIKKLPNTKAAKVPLQCAKCKQWLTVELPEEEAKT